MSGCVWLGIDNELGRARLWMSVLICSIRALSVTRSGTLECLSPSRGGGTRHSAETCSMQNECGFRRELELLTIDGLFATKSVRRNDSLTGTNQPDSTLQFSLVHLYHSFSQTWLALTDSLFTVLSKRSGEEVLAWATTSRFWTWSAP